MLPESRIEVDGKLRVRGAKELVIEGVGTALVFSGRAGTTWSFDFCRSITLCGFTIDDDPLPFVQEGITGRSEKGGQYDFAVCDGYPGLSKEDSGHYRQGYMFEPDRARWKGAKAWRPRLNRSAARIKRRGKRQRDHRDRRDAS